MPHLCVRELLKFLMPQALRNLAFLENACKRFGHKRMFLRQAELESVFPGISEIPVTVSSIPRGGWSTPLSEGIVLAKACRLLNARTVLEVGSFRGYTARLLADNTGPDCPVHTVDTYPEHGEAYRGRPIQNKIRRHVGTLEELRQGPLRGLQFDVVFLDAEHTFAMVENDSRLVLPMLREGGVLFWHDYADWGWITGYNRVPEVLHLLSKKIPILSIQGTSLAVYRKGWTNTEIANLATDGMEESKRNVWNTTSLRAG